MIRTKPRTQSSPIPSEIDPQAVLREKMANKRQARAEKQKLMLILPAAIMAGLVFGLPAFATLGPKAGLGISLIVPIFLLSYSYPRTSLWIFLIYMPFSGTVTYWIGGGNALFQLSKDIFYFPALAGLIQECRRKGKEIIVSKPLIPTLLFLLTCSLLTLFIVNGTKQVLLPACSSISEYDRFLRDASGAYILRDGIVIARPCKNDGDMPFLQGLIGLKVLLGYVPLIFCGFYLIKDKKTLIFLGRLLVTLAIICCVLGLIQFWMLKSGRCQGTVAEGEWLFKATVNAKCFVGGSLLYSPEQGQIRLPGTFVSPWHWGWFLVANSAICFSVAFSDPSILWRGLGLGGMTLVFVNGVVCGQRLAFLGVPLFIVVMAILTGQVVRIKRFIPIFLGLTVLSFIGFSFINPEFIQERIDSFVTRWNTAPPQDFIVKQFQYAINQNRLLGNGLGVSTNSARIFGSVNLIETFHPKLWDEMGFIGLMAFMIFVTHIVIITFNKYRSLKDDTLRNFASGFWVFIVLISYMPYWYPLDTDPVCVYYWLFVGILLKLPEIDKQEQEDKAKLEETIIS